ncbi:MAG: glycosyltransferase [Algisphaera sp.]
MRILYIAMKHDYGDPTRGPSFEQNNFHDALVGMGCDLLHFDAVALSKKQGARATTQRLREIIDTEKPDLLFCVLFTDELDPALMRKIADETATPTVAWFCDDHWRFDDYSADWAPCFNFAVTTAASAVPKYRALRGATLIKSQWAANPFTYHHNPNAQMKYDVSFVGLPHGNRRAIAQVLTHAGLKVDLFGKGWGHGRIDQQQMVDVFNQSRINLNLSNASTVTARGRSTNIEDDPRLHRLARVPKVGRYAAGVYRRARRVQQKIKPPGSRLLKPADINLGDTQQIKGRNFEVPGCGGFLLSGQAQQLDHYYTAGQDIETFASIQELIDKAKYYLAHDDQRRAIAQAGHARTLAEHTWCHRFSDIFNTVGLSPPPLETLLNPTTPGTSQEVD